MVGQSALTESLKTQFAPALRSVGFVGSGKRFRRVAADCIHVVEVQLWRGGGSFAVNLGLQPLDIHVALGGLPDRQKITEPDCEFRQRLADSGSDQWWQFESAEDAMEAASHSAATFLRIGDKRFGEQTGWTSRLRTITPDEVDAGDFSFSGFSSTEVRMARALALMRLATNDKQCARDFALIALKHLGQATRLRGELEAIAREPT